MKEHLSFESSREVCKWTTDCGRVDQAARHRFGNRTMLVADRNCATAQERDRDDGHDKYAHLEPFGDQVWARLWQRYLAHQSTDA